MGISLAIIILLGIPAKKLAERFKLPGLLGMPALRLSFIPGVIEGFTVTFMSVYFLDFTFLQGGILGFIIAAVSPAVVVPSMINLIDKGLGGKKGIPTLILAGASIDDIVAITIFATFLGLYSGSQSSLGLELLNIPISIILGIGLGIVSALILIKVFNLYKVGGTSKVLLLLGLSIILTGIEDYLKPIIGVASLLGVMAIGFIIKERIPKIGKDMGEKLNNLWVFGEIMLFILIGTEVNISIALDAGRVGIIILIIGLIGRSIGVLISLIGTDLNWKERFFCVVSYTPKATVQAAIGAIPLYSGVESGDIILAIAVLSILITAPLGAIGINYFGERWLESR